MNVENGLFCCNTCGEPLIRNGSRLACHACDKEFADIEDGIIVFDGAIEEEDFFEKHIIERLSGEYVGYDRSTFLQALQKRTLWEMDSPNKKAGITEKIWWESHIGKIEYKSVLEVGCGVNYIVPYWLECGNRVVAFDKCRESIAFLRHLLGVIELPETNIEFAVADARSVRFSRTFDIINVNNVLHHIDDKREVFARLSESLADDGRLLIVEPNYYYPPRWFVETEVFDPINLVKNYFVRAGLLEKGEKGVIFSELKEELREAGFEIEFNRKDTNYLGYFTSYWLKNESMLCRVIFGIDAYFLSWALPRLLAPFEYIIAKKSQT